MSDTSFINTPQATDDNYAYLEDLLSITGSFVLIDVMSNDLGGKAKSLYSISDADGNPLDPSALLSVDGLTNGVSAWEATSNGNMARINNGKIEIDLAGTFAGLNISSIQGLTATDVITDTLIYAIRLGNGTLSWAHVSITIQGQNDAASIAGDTEGSIGEDDTDPVTGTLTVSDVDRGEAHTIAASGTTDHGSWNVDADGHWSFTVDNDSVQYLNNNQSVTDSFTITSQDGTASQTVNVTINGSDENHAPVLAGDQSGAVREVFNITNGIVTDLLTTSNSISFTDSDLSDIHSAASTLVSASWSALLPIPAAAQAALENALSVLISDESIGDGAGILAWAFSVGNDLIDFLADGESVVVTYDVTVSDGTESDSKPVTITITGENGVPVVSAVAGDSAGHEFAETDTGLLAAGSLTVTDRDITDQANMTVSNVQVTAGSAGSISLAGLLGYFTIATPVLAADPGSANNLGWNFSSGAEAFNFLADGEMLRLLYTIRATDDSGQGNNIGNGTATITIIGSNDAASMAGGSSGSTGEDDTAPVTGTLTVSDVDRGEAQAQVVTDGATANGYGSYSVDAGGNWSFTVDNDAVQYLDDGESVTDSFVVTSEDGTASETVTVTINGEDDVIILDETVYPSGGSNSVSAADFDGDGDIDLAFSVPNSSAINVLLNNGSGAFAFAPANFAFSVEGIITADVNGDSIVDIIAANTFASSVGVLLGNGDGTFDPEFNYGGGPVIASVAVSDFNEDGKLDIVSSSYYDGQLSIFRGNGNGTFQPRYTIGVGGVSNYGLTVGDFDGEHEDIVLVTANSNQIHILMGDGTGGFAAPVTLTTDPAPLFAKVVDLGDGNQDIIVGNRDSAQVSIYRGNGDGTFQAVQEYAVGVAPYNVTVADMNGDSILDLVSANAGSSSISVLLGNGDETFAPEIEIAVAAGPFDITAADLNGDGAMDISYTASNGLHVLLNVGDFLV